MADLPPHTSPPTYEELYKFVDNIGFNDPGLGACALLGEHKIRFVLTDRRTPFCARINADDCSVDEYCERCHKFLGKLGLGTYAQMKKLHRDLLYRARTVNPP